MDLKKAITLVAFGFLFIFINFNLTINGVTINIMPEFIGWFLLFLAFVPLGIYMKGKSYLHWIPLVLAAVHCAFWVLDIARPELNDSTLSVVRAVLNLVSAAYWFVLFGILEKVANDTGSVRGPRIQVIKVVSLVFYVAIMLMAVFVREVEISSIAAILLTIFSIALIVVTIIALFTLFGLRKEILRQSEQNLIDQVRGNQ